MISIQRAAVPILAAGLLAACGGSVDWVERLQADPLYQRAEKVRESASCASLVPMEFGRSLPVPVREGNGGFKVLFYPLVSSPSKAEVLTPAVEAVFARSPGTDRCARIGSGTPKPLGPAVPAGLSMRGYYRAQTRLFSSLDRAAALYLEEGSPAASDKAVLADFLDAFQSLAEPGLLPDYYRLNPDFWEWLRREIGRSILKP